MSILQKWGQEILTALGRVETDVVKVFDESIGYDYTRIESIAMADRVPADHLPTLAWWKQLAAGIETVVRNTADADEPPVLAKMISKFEDEDCLAQEIADLPAVITELLKVRGVSGERASRTSDYDRFFQVIKKPEDALRPIDDDADFARMMVAGPNPMMITHVDLEYVLHQGDLGNTSVLKTLQKMADKGNLYVADYSALARLPSSTFPNARKYLEAPVVYFTVDSGALKPVAIMLQRPVFDHTFRPDDGEAWKAAKAAVVAADMTMHELVSHLATTHLFIEPFVVATERKLPHGHPVYRLLQPHFEGTLFINDLAAKVLLAPGGGVDQIIAPTIDATRAFVTSTLAGRRFASFDPENDFARRGVGDSVLVDYPYRDDALLLWGTIKTWTTNYIEALYANDEAVEGDAALQAWAAEIASDSGGRVVGFRSKITYRPALANILATILFTASVQHAAVNFPQAEMIDITNFPLALYASADADVLSMLPPFDQALRQVSLGYLLSSVRLARLGEYDSLPSAADAALETFRADLAKAEETIKARNLTRRPYTYLLPSNIPRSINI